MIADMAGDGASTGHLIAEEAELPLDKEPFHWSEFDAFLEYAAP